MRTDGRTLTTRTEAGRTTGRARGRGRARRVVLPVGGGRACAVSARRITRRCRHGAGRCGDGRSAGAAIGPYRPRDRCPAPNDPFVPTRSLDAHSRVSGRPGAPSRVPASPGGTVSHGESGGGGRGQDVACVTAGGPRVNDGRVVLPRHVGFVAEPAARCGVPYTFSMVRVRPGHLPPPSPVPTSPPAARPELCEAIHESARRLRHRGAHPRGHLRPGARRGLVVRDQADPLGRRTRSDDRRPRDADLPDDVVRLQEHPARRGPVLPRRAGQHLHPDPQPDPGRPGAADRRAGGRGGGRRPRLGAGRGDPRDPHPGERRGPHRLQHVAVRRYVQPAAPHAPPVRYRGVLRRRPGRPRRLARGRTPEHQGPVRRDAGQPARQRARHPGWPTRRTTPGCR